MTRLKISLLLVACAAAGALILHTVHLVGVALADDTAVR